MPAVTHYDVLGVAPDADVAAVRRAYLELARVHHPDAGGGDADRMLRLNEAWAVLGDPVARARYDATLGASPARAFTRRLDPDGFVPVDDDEDDDDWRFREDVGDPRTAPRRSVVLAPIVCAVAALAAGSVWLVTAHDAALVATVALGAAALVAFLVAPLVAMAKASRYEGRP